MTLEEKIALIKNNNSVALLAPTFALDFKYPNIIGMLKKLGFKQVTELTFGARMVNHAYAEYIVAHPEQKYFIASPCPTVVAMAKAQYPDLVQYLMPIISPMAAMGKIFKKYNPNYKTVFISPCLAKENLEAPKFKEYIDAVITLQDLKKIFEKENIKEEDFEQKYFFDSFICEYTKIYPVSGGLASTSHLKKVLLDQEVLVTDGFENIKKAFEEIRAGTSKYRFLDILNCDGGCIGGPSINNKDLPVEKKKEIIREYTQRSIEFPTGKCESTIKSADGVDMATTF